MQLGLELPKGFSIPLEAEDLAVFFSQQCSLRQMQDYLAQKRRQTQADIAVWLRERPWDTHPVTAAQHALRDDGEPLRKIDPAQVHLIIKRIWLDRLDTVRNDERI